MARRANQPLTTDNQDLNFSDQSPSLSLQENIPGRVETGSGSTAQIRSWAELALLNDPLNARAFRILGQLSQLTAG